MSATFLVDLGPKVVGGVTFNKNCSASTDVDNGLVIDMQLSDGPVFVHVAGGQTVSTTTANISLKLQECDTTNGTFTDIADSALPKTYNQTTVLKAFDVLTVEKRSKQYVRGVMSCTGTGLTTVPVAVTLFGMRKISGTGDGSL